MRAIVAAPDTDEGFRLTELPDPTPGRRQVLVDVRHAALNAGEIRHLGLFPAGAVLGYDAAGHVVRGAEGGSGPPEGARVVAFGPGAWARLAAIDVESVSPVTSPTPGAIPATPIALVGYASTDRRPHVR